MFTPVATYISENYTYEDYLKLHFKINSPPHIWKKAIEIFIDRINSRYFGALDKLMEQKDRLSMLKYGFAIVTIQCSLIDTLAKFRYGSNRQIRRFTDFLEEYILLDFPKTERKNIGTKFYEDIRCGLVHSGSTENMSGLSCDSPGLITILKNGALSVNLLRMDEALRKYFENYVNMLNDKSKGIIRANFVKTMNRVCKAI